MKNRTKLIAVVCSIILFLGVLTSFSQRIYGTHMGKSSAFFPAKVNGIQVDVSVKEEQKKELEPFQNIDIKTDEASIRLIPGDAFKIYFCYYTDLRKLHYENQNGMLKIWDEKNPKYTYGMDYFTISGLWNVPENKIDIYYPSNTPFQNIKIFNEYGDTQLNGITADNLALDTHSGDADLKNICVQNMDFKVDYGDLALTCPQDFQGEQALFALHSGNLSILNLSCKKEIKIQSEYGDFTGQHLSGGTFESKSYSGDVKMTDIKSDKMMISNNYGDVHLQTLTTQELQINSSNGDVTMSGNLGTNTTVTSQNGDIDLEIAGEKSAYEYMLSSQYGELFINGTVVETMHGEGIDSIQGGAGAKNKIKAESSNGSIYLSFGKK